LRTVNVIGLGYVGLPTALMLSASGVAVHGSDLNGDLIRRLSDGENTIDEDGFDDLFARARTNGIAFSTDCAESDIYIIAVPTPFVEETKKVDADYITEAIDNVLNVCGDSCVIVIESTVSPGTTKNRLRPFIDSNPKAAGKIITLAHAPERILPGNMIYELIHNSRVIGADDEDTGKLLTELYASFCEGKIVVTDIAVAEMSKVVENTYRDVNIAFANELLKLCDEAGMDAREVIRIANMHPRVDILSPGPGVGGHCIPVDPWFLVGDFPDMTDLISAARRENDSMPAYVEKRIREIMDAEGIADIGAVGLYGLAYKENIGDVRESPTIALIRCFETGGGVPVSYDPHVETVVASGQTLDRDEFFTEAKLIVIMVYHKELLDCLPALAGKVILDTRGNFSSGNFPSGNFSGRYEL
jgi:UDP-N-acetyl-D-mannosaminuronic acid dehydrogenase